MKHLFTSLFNRLKRKQKLLIELSYYMVDKEGNVSHKYGPKDEAYYVTGVNHKCLFTTKGAFEIHEP